MTIAVFHKLLAIFLTVGLCWGAGRMRWLGDERKGADPARTLSNAAFYIFVPALLFRTTSRLDFGALPWATLAAFFVPVLLLLTSETMGGVGQQASKAGGGVGTHGPGVPAAVVPH